MSERIIPIVQTDAEMKDDTEKDQSKITEIMEQLALQQQKSNQKSLLEYMEAYDVFEERTKYTLPNANVPEKIIIVIDRAQDIDCSPFRIEKSSFSPLSMFRRSLQLFLKLKHMINKDNEFALVVLNENCASWILNFTSDLKKVNQEIEKLSQCEVEDVFDMNNLFQEIAQHVQVPVTDCDEIAPPFVIRTLLLYGRSYTIPKFKTDVHVSKMLKKPYCYFDVLYTHEPVDKSNHCNTIFAALQGIDRQGLSYFLPVCRDTKRLHNSMAKLLAHPWQRSIQKLKKS